MEVKDHRYDKHFLLNEETVLDYVRAARTFFTPDAQLKAKEIGDGNINYVFRIWEEATGKSLVIKQADQRLKSSGRALSLQRNRIEAELLKLEDRYAPGMVPKIYHYDETMCALVMEDISDHHNLRKELMKGKIYDRFAEEITDFMAKVLLSTSDLLMDRHEKKEKVRAFINIDLCDITEDLVFTEPYYDYKGRNRITEGNERFVKKVLYDDECLKTEVGTLRDAFMNHAQALLHGDLHSGSIFINETGIKVIDPEFAFYGPIGYDVGNVIGNMFFTLASHLVRQTGDLKFCRWVEKTIADLFDRFQAKAIALLSAQCHLPLYTQSFLTSYVGHIMSDAVGMAGTEIIRRIVGDTKVEEIETIEAGEAKRSIERVLILTASQFIKNRDAYTEGKQLVEEFCRMKESIWS